MQEPVNVSELFQQINSLRNDMEIAAQRSQEEAGEYENDIVEIEQLKQKETHLREKNNAKLRKCMAIDGQLHTKRTLVSFSRQRVEALNASNEALSAEITKMKNTLTEERSKTHLELLSRSAEVKSTFQIELEKLNEETKALEISFKELEATISSLESKCNNASDIKRSLDQQRAQLEDMNAQNAEMELRRTELQKADQEIASLTESLRSQLTERMATWKQLSQDLDTAKENYSYLVDLNSSLRVHYDNVKHQAPLPRKRSHNFVYNV